MLLHDIIGRRFRARTAATYNVASPVTLKTRSGSDLKVYFHKQDGRFGDVFLEGDARIIYQGQLQPEAWQSLT